MDGGNWEVKGIGRAGWMEGIGRVGWMERIGGLGGWRESDGGNWGAWWIGPAILFQHNFENNRPL